MKNCNKCQVEMDDNTNYLYNGYCQKCWPNISLNERKSLPGFCKECGDGWNYVTIGNSPACLNCFRKTHGVGTFPKDNE